MAKKKSASKKSPAKTSGSKAPAKKKKETRKTFAGRIIDEKTGGWIFPGKKRR